MVHHAADDSFVVYSRLGPGVCNRVYALLHYGVFIMSAEGVTLIPPLVVGGVGTDHDPFPAERPGRFEHMCIAFLRRW